MLLEQRSHIEVQRILETAKITATTKDEVKTMEQVGKTTNIAGRNWYRETVETSIKQLPNDKALSCMNALEFQWEENK